MRGAWFPLVLCLAFWTGIGYATIAYAETQIIKENGKIYEVVTTKTEITLADAETRKAAAEEEQAGYVNPGDADVEYWAKRVSDIREVLE